MSAFDSIIQETANRFGLGDKASVLMRELLSLITDAPGGISAFIDKFKSAGLAREASEWLGNPDSAALAPSQVQQALGSTTVNSIAQKVGLSGSAASAALGYLIPKVVGQLTPGGIATALTPSSVSDFMRTTAPTYTPPSYGSASSAASAARAAAAAESQSGRWAVPLLASLALLGLGWYLLSDRSGEEQKQAAGLPGIATPSATNNAMTPAARTGAPTRLAIRSENGVVTVSGMVRDEATRNSIMDGLRSVYGNAVNGNIVINPNASPTPWLANFRDGLQQLKASGTITDADRERILGSLRSTVDGPNLALGAPDMSDIANEASTKAMKALASLGANFRSSDVVDILNTSIINFQAGNAELPAMGHALLQQAAARLKQLPANTTIEIRGHTDNTGDLAANLQLSQSRAEAVKAALVQLGVNPTALVARGYGSASPVASNETAEGRYKNRRIEYLIK